jgi:lysyl-tRNA synthetase class 2
VSTSRAPKAEIDWRPTAGRQALDARALLLGAIRSFFAERGVVEVETPLLARVGVTDPHLENLESNFTGPGHPDGLRLYLQTSPEFHMKRLLADGCGPIYQIAKAFRDGEKGARHNPEFTLLEWYRPGWDHHELMNEMSELLSLVLDCPVAERCTYGSLFEDTLSIDPHSASTADLRRVAHQRGLEEPPALDDRDDWLALLMTSFIEPRLGDSAPLLVFDYPASQASLAKIRYDDPPVAERFEVYYRGVELANGFHELTDAAEQEKRFDADRDRRHELGRRDAEIDERLVAALASGMPSCAGVALGIDRLLMLKLGAESIEEVIQFPIDRA